MADNKPTAYEYQLGGGCLTGVKKDEAAVNAILDAIQGSRELYRAQGRLTVRIENPPEDSGSGA